jgi:hypothetical protein
MNKNNIKTKNTIQTKGRNNKMKIKTQIGQKELITNLDNEQNKQKKKKKNKNLFSFVLFTF